MIHVTYNTCTQKWRPGQEDFKQEEEKRRRGRGEEKASLEAQKELSAVKKQMVQREK